MMQPQDGFSMVLDEEQMAGLQKGEGKHRKLGIDKAAVTVTSSIEFKTRLFSQSDVCWKVPATQLLIATSTINVFILETLSDL